MELTLESAFSVGGMVGHLSYVLLIISMLMRRIGPLRVFVILSALVAILYDGVFLKDPIGLFWETTLVTVNIYQLTALWLIGKRARFSVAEEALIQSRFPDLARGEARRLLNRGKWVDIAPGTALTVEGQMVDHLTYFAEGEAEISYRGTVFTRCGAGSFIGEMSILDKGAASTDVTVTVPSHVWRIEAATLRQVHRQDETLSDALTKAFALDWRDKLLIHRDGHATGEPLAQ